MSNNIYFNFDLLLQLLKQLEEYKSDPSPLHKDLYQDEIRSLSRMLDDEEQEEAVIEYFCRKGKRP